MVYPVLVGQSTTNRLYYAGEEDAFGPFYLCTQYYGEPWATGLTRSDAIEWMVEDASWGEEDARHQVDEAIQWYCEQVEREAEYVRRAQPEMKGCDACGQ